MYCEPYMLGVGSMEILCNPHVSGPRLRTGAAGWAGWCLSAMAARCTVVSCLALPRAVDARKVPSEAEHGWRSGSESLAGPRSRGIVGVRARAWATLTVLVPRAPHRFHFTRCCQSSCGAQHTGYCWTRAAATLRCARFACSSGVPAVLLPCVG